MDTLAEKLNIKLHEWDASVADQVRELITEIIDLADNEVLDVMRSRVVEQEILDLIDKP